MTRITFISLFLLTGCMAPVGQEEETRGISDPWTNFPEETEDAPDEYATPPEEPRIPANTGGTVNVAGPAPSTGGTPVQVAPVTGGAPSSGGETADPVEPGLALSQGCQAYWDLLDVPGSQAPLEGTTIYHCCYNDSACDLAIDPQPHGEKWALWWGCSHTWVDGIYGSADYLYDEERYATYPERFTNSLGCH